MTRRIPCLATIHLDLYFAAFWTLFTNPNWYACVPLVVGLLRKKEAEKVSSSSLHPHTLYLSTRHVLSLHTHTHTQDTYIQERAEAMENIHSTIVELGSIFKQLAGMVQEQEEQVVR